MDESYSSNTLITDDAIVRDRNVFILLSRELIFTSEVILGARILLEKNPKMLMIVLSWILLFLAGHAGNLCTVSASRTPLHIAGLLPLSEKDGWSRFFGYSALVGANQAIVDINNRSDILPNYTLVLNVSDTEGNLPAALNRLYEFLYEPPVKVAIFGSLLSSLTEVVAEVIGKWSIVEMSPGATTPVLSNRDKYPHIYRMLTSAAGFSGAEFRMCGMFGWNKIATLHETTEPHVGVINELQRLVSTSNVSIIAAESFYKDPYEAMERLKSKDVRIIVASFYERMVRKVFCSIFKLNMYGPNYVWMIPGYYSNGWWMVEEEGVSCTVEELKQASEGYLTIAYSKYGRGEEPGVGGRTPAEFRHEMADVVGYEITITDRGSVAAGYDCIWALAMGLESAEARLGRGLDSYRYGDDEFARTVGRAFQDLSFPGMSGPVQFSEGGDRSGDLLIEQNIDGVENIVGIYNNIEDEITWNRPTEELWYYSDGKPPFDSDITKTIELLQSIPISVLATVSVLAALGMVLGVMFLVFNIWKRNNRQIKMSSPKVNNIIATGILLAYLGVVLLGIDRSMVEETSLLTICRVRSWIIPISFTLAFGGMFTKMWRVYSIVIANKTKRKVIKDYYLFGIIAVLLLADLAILIPWQIIDPIQIKENRVPIPQTEDDLTRHEKREKLYVNCTSNNNTIWTLVIIIYKAFVVVFGAFLAWSTRNVKVSGLNDSYYVGLSIYNTVICCMVAVSLSFLNTSSIVVTFALVSGFLLLCITISLCMLFFPKVIAVYRKNEVADENFTGIRVGTTMVPTMAHKPRALGGDMPTTSAHNGEFKTATTDGSNPK
ncbi:gamma-aminobutyric acid type B receptor subunit 2-like [Patiria miniata]|uniref:Gamma-aminobutyric acid type B receptor subunit 2 n=1 Tax=Patiria miniata TaxID=46514 RepID=A0A913ZQQ4_PATMI|nr:gamma-aminobutyric acid type B receptor subunit 2-like [Patiria miniata]